LYRQLPPAGPRRLLGHLLERVK
ncbi:MAG: hypothetical protein RLZZ524_2680, partial [Pseudomonadota bacterium]